MKDNRRFNWIMCVTVILSSIASAGPKPLPHHPGNIFLVGEEVVLSAPEKDREAPVSWKLVDDLGMLVKDGDVPPDDKSVSLGLPGVGWYRVEFVDSHGDLIEFTTAAILDPMESIDPDETPVAVDAAISWGEVDSPGEFEEWISLGSLAGVGWIRDRLRWREVQPSPDEFIPETKYDRIAQIQKDYGMKVLQTFHGTPEWAVEEGERRSRFPGDLRIAYRFSRAMAERFQGTIDGWEPWNEANAGNFGGHTIDEMCSYQKACYLGFNAGDPDLLVGWNPCGGVNTDAIAEGVLRNRTWPYFDVYSIHSYDWPDSYNRLWKPTRKAASGKSIWVTEADRGMHADPDSTFGDYTEENDRLKGEFIAHSYIHSLASGSSRHFHFLLRDYKEQDGAVQFGLLRHDLTPRRSDVALANLGRLLPGAEYLGQWVREGSPQVQIHALRARPMGVAKDILVGWSEVPGDWSKRGKTTADWNLPPDLRVDEVIDHLGRSQKGETPEKLRSAATFLILPAGESSQLPLQTRPKIAERKEEPISVVLQLQTPEQNRMKRVKGWTQEHERTIEPGESIRIELIAYNFGDEEVEGSVRLIEVPADWDLDTTEWDLNLESMERTALPLVIARPEGDRGGESNWLGWQGDFTRVGGKSDPVLVPDLAVRIIDPEGIESGP